MFDMMSFLVMIVILIMLEGCLCDYLDDKAMAIRNKTCPFVDWAGLFPYCESSRNRGDASGVDLKYQLITFNGMNGESGLPIVDLDRSINVTQWSGFDTECVPTLYDSDKALYDSFFNLSLITSPTEWEWYNGMFLQDDFFEKILPMLQEISVSKDREVLATTMKIFKYHSVSVDPKNIRVLSEFQDIVDNFVPSFYDEDAYKRFIDIFGTHVATQCDFGGDVEQDLFVKSCAMQKFFHNTLLDDMCEDINAFLADPTFGKRNGSKEYKDSTTINLDRITGGNPLLTEKSEWIKRIKSFPLDPVAVKCKFSPIQDFISDKMKKINIKRFINEYVVYSRDKRERAFQQLTAKKKIPMVLSTNTVGGKLQQQPILLLPDDTTGDFVFQYNWDPQKGPTVHGNITFRCLCKSEDRACGCWMESSKDCETWFPKRCFVVMGEDMGKMCISTYGYELDKDTIKFSKAGSQISGCLYDVMSVYYEYQSQYFDYKKYPKAHGGVFTSVNCEEVKIGSDPHIPECLCQLKQ